MSTNTFLKIEDLEVYYGGIHALHKVSLEIEEGEIVCIIGSNGAGKSTLLRTIAGDKEKASGRIIFRGKELPSRSHQVVAQGISLVPEGRRIFANLSVKENLMVGAYSRKDKVAIKKDFEETLELFPRLKERIGQMGGTLSGGEQQMLAVGRAIMARPKLLCLDEPSLGLAPIVVDELFDKIKKINKEFNQTILLVEQNAFIALETAQRAYILNTGRITMEGNTSELINNSEIQESYLGLSRTEENPEL